MDYLFFDIECADCSGGTGKICEFGYVVVDEAFNVVEQDEFIINPDSKFDYYALKKILSFTKAEYLSHEKYPHFYPKISSLFAVPDRVVIGQNTKGDLNYLADESVRYSLPLINAKYYDLGEIFKRAEDLADAPGVERMLGLLELQMETALHVALTDAQATVLILKTLCAKHALTLAEILAKNGDIKEVNGGRFANKTLDAMIDALERDSHSVSNAELHKYFLKIAHVRPKGKRERTAFSGKRVSFSILYEKAHTREASILIREIVDRGGEYTDRTTTSDYLVVSDADLADGTIERCARYRAATKHPESRVTILKVSELLAMLNMDETALAQAPWRRFSAARNPQVSAHNPLGV